MVQPSDAVTAEAFTGRMRAKYDHLWRELTAHPFVTEMAAGELELNKFQFYVEQNLLYLPQYARAIALGAAKSRDDEELESFAASLANIVDVEIPQNLKLCRRVRALTGTRTPMATEMAPGALNYTSYLLATAAVAGPTEILTLIMPCAWTYGDIGVRLEPGMAQHELYSDWISFFATDDYSKLVSNMRRKLDDQVAALGTVEQERLAGVFHTAMRMEKGFWDMGYRMECWEGPTA